MGKSSPTPPAPPDPVATAQAQAAANKESAMATTQLGNPNIVNPYGTSTTQYGADAFFSANPSVLSEYKANSGGMTPLDYAKQ